MNSLELKSGAAKDLTQIDDYKIIKVIGQGGMSVVYEALDQRLKRPVALKMLHPFLASTAEYRKRFFREAEAVARLEHPNIVQIFDVINPKNHPDQLYIVTELLVGKTLKEFVGVFSLSEIPELAALIVWQIAQALEHAHQKGIIHRDIKPENIMIKSDGLIKLMDFGIASLESDESLTQTGTLLGSLAHLAPEVISGHKISPQSDIFSLSTVFYWLVSGQLPFTENSPHALLKAIVEKPAKRLQQLSPFVMDDLASIIDKGMAKNSRDRFRSASEMSESIENFLASVGLNVDMKQMMRALASPETELPAFKRLVFAQIQNKAAWYQTQGAQTMAFALKCRLDINVTSNSLLRPRLAKIFYIAISAVILSVAAFFYFFASDRLNPAPIQRQHLPKDQLPEALDASLDQPIEVTSKETPQKDVVVPDPPTPAPVKEIKASQKSQRVDLVIWPFANVFLNEKQIATDTKSLTLNLTGGTHHLKFTHEYAATVEKVLDISEIKDPIELNISLYKSKAAFLVINANIDADIAVAGHYKGSTKNSVLRPVVIPIPDRKHALKAEVMIKHEGFQTQMHELEFIAGKTNHLTITLDALTEIPANTPEDQL